MAQKNHPLELILRHNGMAELIDSRDHTIWASDSDEDFREEFHNEFLTEDDTDDILSYLFETRMITDYEAKQFESGRWDVTEESLDTKEEDEPDDPSAVNTHLT
jgi:hypothetical protein